MNKPQGSVPNKFLQNPKTQLILFLLALAYIVSPIDFIPDAIVGLGWVDDLTVFLAEIVSFLIYLKNRKKQFENEAKNRTGEE